MNFYSDFVHGSRAATPTKDVLRPSERFIGMIYYVLHYIVNEG